MNNNDQDTARHEYELAHAMPQTLEAFTKMEMDKIANSLITKALGGERDPAELYIKLDFISKALKKAMDNLKPAAIDEISKYDLTNTCMGVEVKIGNTVKYDYSGYDGWVKAKKVLTDIQEKMKSACNQSGEFLDGDEIIPPAVKNYSADSITPTYTKE